MKSTTPRDRFQLIHRGKLEFYFLPTKPSFGMPADASDKETR